MVCPVGGLGALGCSPAVFLTVSLFGSCAKLLRDFTGACLRALEGEGLREALRPIASGD